MIKVGAMDEFGTRSSMLENLDSIRQTATQFQSEIDGQDNLFADVATESTTHIQDTFAVITEYPTKELLSFEKELLGMYLTSHPLADQLEAVQNRSNKFIKDLDQTLHKDQSFLFGGILTRVKVVRTKKSGKEMAFGVLQDNTGSIEVVFFPRLYESDKDKIIQDKVVLMKAKVEFQDDELKLIAEKVTIPKQENVEYESNKKAHEIFIPRKTEKDTLQKLGKLLKSKPGKMTIIIIIPNGSKPERLKLPYQVEWNDDLEKEVQELLG